MQKYISTEMDRINYDQVTHVNDSIDPFIVFRKVFFDFGYKKCVKPLNIVCFSFHSAAFLMQVHFAMKNFSLDLLIRYGYTISSTAFMLAGYLTWMRLEPENRKILDEFGKIFWSIDSAGQKTRWIITERSKKIINVSYVIFVFFGFTIILMLPQMGDHDEWFLGNRVFEEYFGFWAKIPEFIFFVTLPLLVYTCVQPCFTIFYGILQIQIQIFLIVEHISQISADYDGIDERTKSHDLNYQEEMHKRLCFCIKHHAALKGFIGNINRMIQGVFLIFLILSILSFTTLFSFISNCFEDASNILKMRFICLILSAQFLYLIYILTGQLLIDETGRIHMILMNCPWYIWNIKNRKVLLIFMNNCLEPTKISFVGFTLDFQLIPVMLKTVYSYTTVLYNLKNGK